MTDHQTISIATGTIPTALIVYGDFNIGGSEEGNNPSLGNNQNLDFLSRILDAALVNLVDLFGDRLNHQFRSHCSGRCAERRVEFSQTEGGRTCTQR